MTGIFQANVFQNNVFQVGVATGGATRRRRKERWEPVGPYRIQEPPKRERLRLELVWLGPKPEVHSLPALLIGVRLGVPQLWVRAPLAGPAVPTRVLVSEGLTAIHRHRLVALWSRPVLGLPDSRLTIALAEGFGSGFRFCSAQVSARLVVNLTLGAEPLNLYLRECVAPADDAMLLGLLLNDA